MTICRGVLLWLLWLSCGHQNHAFTIEMIRLPRESFVRRIGERTSKVLLMWWTKPDSSSLSTSSKLMQDQKADNNAMTSYENEVNGLTGMTMDFKINGTIEKVIDLGVNGAKFPNDRETKNGFFQPRPPSSPFATSALNITSYDELLGLAYQSAAEVSVLKCKVQSLEEQLELKQLLIENSLKEWSSQYDENQYEAERLQREVKILQDQLPAVQNLLRQEQLRSEELQERLHEMDYTLEYQQMEFDTQKTDLLKQVEESNQQLKLYSSQWKQQEEDYKSKVATLEEELQREQTRFTTATSDMSRQQDAFKEEKTKLEDRISDQRKKIEQLETDLKNDRSFFAVTKAEMRAALDEEQTRLTLAEQQLKEAEVLYNKIELELNDKLATEQIKVLQLQTRLEEAQTNFSTQKAVLEQLLVDEQTKVHQLTLKLKEERMEFATQKTNYERDIENQKRVMELKRRQMKDRYDSIRTEMMSLWESAKRQGREQVQSLTKKYEAKIQDMSASINTLENELLMARNMTENLDKMVQEVMEQKRDAERERLIAIEQYKLQIGTLQQQVRLLKDEIRVLKEVLRSKDKELSSIKGSVRKMVKQSIQLTWQRITRSTSPATVSVQLQDNRITYS